MDRALSQSCMEGNMTGQNGEVRQESRQGRAQDGRKEESKNQGHQPPWGSSIRKPQGAALAGGRRSHASAREAVELENSLWRDRLQHMWRLQAGRAGWMVSL